MGRKKTVGEKNVDKNLSLDFHFLCWFFFDID